MGVLITPGGGGGGGGGGNQRFNRPKTKNYIRGTNNFPKINMWGGHVLGTREYVCNGVAGFCTMAMQLHCFKAFPCLFVGQFHWLQILHTRLCYIV